MKKKDKFVPYDKMQKKKKREENQKQRNTWEINPVTRKEPSNAYKRKKQTEHEKSLENWEEY